MLNRVVGSRLPPQFPAIQARPCGFGPFRGITSPHAGSETACRLWGSLRLNRSPILRALLVSAALGSAFALSGCNTDSNILPMSEKAARPLSDKMVKDIQTKNMEMESPILVRLFKEESELEVWKQERSGRYALLKTYPICRWSGELGPKVREGDRQAPEGFYSISPGQMNPNSQYYLSFDLGYPNAYDRAYGRTGSQLMVHGDCSSRGCYSMTDEQISEIYALGRDAFFGGQKSFQVQAYPFRMTAQNLARHRNNPNIAFWKMLKKGNDHFEVSGLEPKVNVCEKHYVFDAQAPGGASRALAFSASGKCPVYEVPEEIASAVRDKERTDEIQFADLSRRNIALAPLKTNADGGMHPIFVEAVKKNQIGVHPQEAMFVTTPPGTIPATVRPPRIPELAGSPLVPDAAPAAEHEMAIAETKPAAKSGGSLFGGLFASKSSDSKPSEQGGTAIDRMARLVGLRGNDKDTAETTPKAKPAAKATRVASHGAIRPAVAKPAEPAKIAEPPKAAEPVRTAEPAKKVEPVRTTEAQAPAPARTQAAPTTGTAMNGAAPVMPGGNFDSRWSGFR
jgi:murein L,D-transpeptidase YafK